MLRSAPSRPRAGPPRPRASPPRCLVCAWHKPGWIGRARPGFARAPPSDASVLPGPVARWNDRRPDGAVESGWSAGRARWDDGMILAPGSPDGPSGCRSGPLGQASGVGQPTRSLGRLAGPQNRILTRNTRPANSSPRLISPAVLAARRLPTRRRGPHESFKDAPEAPVRCRAPPRGVGSPLPLPEMGSRVRRGDGIAG